MTSDIALANLTEGDIKARLAALAAVEDDPNQWAEVNPDFGKVVVFENVGDNFRGLLVGRKITQQPDLANKGQMRDATVYEFMGTDSERYSIWGSASLNNKLDDVPDGTPVYIEYRGQDSFVDKETRQPRVIKRYKVLIPTGQR